ncbi:MAG: hypothetical protein ACRC5M_03625 [Anaeroplasmataceae bacterium]
MKNYVILKTGAGLGNYQKGSIVSIDDESFSMCLRNQANALNKSEDMQLSYWISNGYIMPKENDIVEDHENFLKANDITETVTEEKRNLKTIKNEIAKLERKIQKFLNKNNVKELQKELKNNENHIKLLTKKNLKIRSNIESFEDDVNKLKLLEKEKNEFLLNN